MGQTTLSESLRAVEAEIAAGRAERALERCQQLATQFPRALAVQRVLGEIYLALRKPREALGALDRALAGNPEDARACCARAIVHQLHGNSAGALDYYRRACDITPDDQVLRAAYRELAASLGQPPYQPSRTGLARLYLRGDLLSHALREWESLVAEQPDSLEAQVGLTEALWRSGALDAAADHSRRILDNSPSCVKALLILAALEHDAGHAEEARRLVVRAAELDPDQRIAQSLFADRLAAGDRILSLNDDTAPAVGVPRPAGRSAPLAAPGAERPRVWTRPLMNQATQPPQRAAGGSASLPLPPEPPRASALPPDFHSMFAETEYMLWSREDTEKHEALDMGRVGRGYTPSLGSVREGELPPGLERGTPSSALVPPALREQGFSLEETEARAAINWVNWLQAQGARLHGSAPPASAAQAARRRTVPPSDPQPTGTLPQTTPEALRQMFAMLESDLPQENIVDGEVVVEASDAPPASADAAVEPLPAWTGDHSQYDTELEERAHSGSEPRDFSDDLHETVASVAQADDEQIAANDPPITDAQTGGHAAVGSPATDAAPTLEALERDFARSGFESFELAPGGLASLQAEPAPVDDADEPVVSLGAAATTPSEEVVAPAASQDPPRDSAEPASDDYVARLARARLWQRTGRTGEALAEYRTILKYAPDLLPDVLGELRQRIADAPEDPEAHRLLGDAYVQQGEYLGALEAYNRAVALAESDQ